MVVPSPGTLSAFIVPPWSVTIFFTIESPIPLPAFVELLDECEDAAKDEASSFGKQLKLDVDALIARTGGETK